MNKLAVAILGRLVFANYNAFGLGSIALFFAIGLALMLGGGHGKPNTLHVAAAEPAKVSVSSSTGEVAGVSTINTSIAASTSAQTMPSSNTIISSPKKKNQTVAQAPPSVPFFPSVFAPPAPEPTPEPTPDPTPPPPPPVVIPFNVDGPVAINIALGGSVVIPFTTADNSLVTWQLTSGPNTTGSIFVFPVADPVLASSYSFSLVVQPTAVVGNTMTFTVHVTDVARSIDTTKSVTATIIAAPVVTPPPVTPPPVTPTP